MESQGGIKKRLRSHSATKRPEVKNDESESGKKKKQSPPKNWINELDHQGKVIRPNDMLTNSDGKVVLPPDEGKENQVKQEVKNEPQDEKFMEEEFMDDADDSALEIKCEVTIDYDYNPYECTAGNNNLQENQRETMDGKLSVLMNQPHKQKEENHEKLHETPKEMLVVAQPLQTTPPAELGNETASSEDDVQMGASEREIREPTRDAMFGEVVEAGSVKQSAAAVADLEKTSDNSEMGWRDNQVVLPKAKIWCLKSLTIDKNSQSTDLKDVPLKNLESLSIDGRRCSIHVLDILKKANLKELKVGEYAAYIFRELDPLPPLNIRKLVLRKVPVNWDFLDNTWLKFPSLEELTIHEFPVPKGDTGKNSSFLKLKNLRKISLKKLHEMSEESKLFMGSVLSQMHLTHIVITNRVKITDANLIQWKYIDNLRNGQNGKFIQELSVDGWTLIDSDQ